MDAFTLVVAGALAGTIMACTMGLLYLASKRERCLLDWAVAGLCFAAGNVLGASATALQLSHLVVPGCANALYITGHFAVLAGLRRHLGLTPGWPLMAAVALLIVALHALPFVHASVSHRLYLFTPLILALNLAVAITAWRHVGHAALAPYLPLILLELLFMSQLALRTAYLLASEGQRLTFMGSQFLQTSGSLLVLVFLSVATMSCALIYSHQQAQQLRLASLTDALTGWRNRRALEDSAGRAFAHGHAGEARLAFITFDIDHFKAINDRFGHAVGDCAIRHVTAQAASVLRRHDGAFRIGGEEFAVLVTDEEHATVCDIAQRLRERVAGMPLRLDDLVVTMTVSVGVAARSCGDRQWEDVLHRADAALYRAKADGRNRVVVQAHQGSGAGDLHRSEAVSLRSAGA